MALAVTLGGRVAVSSQPLQLDEASLGGRRAQVAFAVLVLERHRSVSEEELAEAMWPSAMPPSWRSGVRTAVAQVRSFLARFDPAPSVARVGAGSYRLALPAGSAVDIEQQPLDLAHAEALLAEGQTGEALALARAVPRPPPSRRPSPN